MNHAALDHSSPLAGNKRTATGLARLPGIEGFYVLTAGGELGRYSPSGEFVDEPELSKSLRDVTNALLRHYRQAAADDVAIGLMTPRLPDKPWSCASLVFSDAALRVVYRTSDVAGAPLTAFQKRNRIKSVYQGMELLLSTRKASQPSHPQFCPVLFEPEHGSASLSRRYGVSMEAAERALEVLDLMALLDPAAQRHPSLARMVADMAEARIAPEVRSDPALMLVESADASPANAGWASSVDYQGLTPWEQEREQQQADFNDGDPVTYWLLSWFAPFNELDDLQRQFVARGHRVTKKPAGATLIERGSREDVTLYLIDGTLELEAFDGRTMTIAGGTRRAHLPISQLRPHAYTVRAATSVSVIYASQDMVREIKRITTTYHSRPGIEVTAEDSSAGYPRRISAGAVADWP